MWPSGLSSEFRLVIEVTFSTIERQHLQCVAFCNFWSICSRYSNMNLNLKKAIFFLLLLVENVIAFILISIAFLSGPPAEGPNRLTGNEYFFRLTLYALVISLIFSALTVLLSFLFRRCFNFSTRGILKIFIYQVAALMSIFAATCFYLFVM